MFDYVGSFQSAVAAPKRERRHRVFAELARKADSSLGHRAIADHPHPAHTVRLIGQPAYAMVLIWKEIGLLLGRDYPPVEQRAETAAAGR